MSEPAPLDTAALDRLIARAQELQLRWKTLPCFPHIEAKDTQAAVDACEDEKAHETCEFASYADCPRLVAERLYDEAAHHLTVGMVETTEREIILPAARLTRRVRLADTDALRLVRAVLMRKRMRVALQHGAELRDGVAAPGEVLLTGSESLVALCGNRGVGKTVAACYAIARMGGIYHTAYQFSRPNDPDLDLARAKRGPVLVLDQLGREHMGDSAFTRARIEEVLDARYAARRLTFLVGNIDWPQFVSRYEGVIADRVRGDGAFVMFAGESLRPRLRAQVRE